MTRAGLWVWISILVLCSVASIIWFTMALAGPAVFAALLMVCTLFYGLAKIDVESEESNG